MRVLFSGYFGFGNLGDEALLSVWVEALKNAHELACLSGAPAFSKKWFRIKIYPRTFSSFFSALKESDVLFFPGGSIFQDRTSLRSLLFYAFQVLLARKWKKKIFFYGQGLGPFKSSFSLKLSLFCLKQAERCTVRDRRSFQLCRGYGLDVREVWDVGFAFPSQPLCENQDVLVPYKNYCIPHAFLKKNLSFHQAISFLFHPLYDRPFFSPSFLVWKELVNPLKGARSALCFRLHGAIFAAACATPFFVFCHDPKQEGFLEKMNWEFYSSLEDTRKMEEKLSFFYHNLPELKKLLLSQKESFQSQVRNEMSSFRKECFGV